MLSVQFPYASIEYVKLAEERDRQLKRRKAEQEQMQTLQQTTQQQQIELESAKEERDAERELREELAQQRVVRLDVERGEVLRKSQFGYVVLPERHQPSREEETWQIAIVSVRKSKAPSSEAPAAAYASCEVSPDKVYACSRACAVRMIRLFLSRQKSRAVVVDRTVSA